MSIKVIKRFPDINSHEFDFSVWNRQFLSNNVILNGHYSSYYYPSHWTPLSMKCAFGGSEQYITSNVKYSVNDKVYLIMNDGTYYDCVLESDKKVESFTINFQNRFAADILYSLSNSNEKLLEYPVPDNSIAAGFFEKLYEHDKTTLNLLHRMRSLINADVIDESAIEELLHAILTQMFMMQFSSLKHALGLKAVRHSTRIELYRRLHLARDYIRSNYHEGLTLDLLARVSCLSPHHFLRSFKEAFGKTPHKYITEKRLEASKEMLKTSSIPVMEICTLTGFESLSSFGSLFKKHFGLSPEKYRNSGI